MIIACRRVAAAIGAFALAAGMIGVSASPSASGEAERRTVSEEGEPGPAVEALKVGDGWLQDHVGESPNPGPDYEGAVVVLNPNFGLVRFSLRWYTGPRKKPAEYRLRVGKWRAGACHPRYVVRGLDDGSATPVVDRAGEFTELRRDRDPRGNPNGEQETLFSGKAKGVAADCAAVQLVKRGSGRKPNVVYDRDAAEKLEWMHESSPTLHLKEKWPDPHRLRTGEWETLALEVSVTEKYEGAIDASLDLTTDAGAQVRPARIDLGNLRPYHKPRRVEVDVRMTRGGESAVEAVVSAAYVRKDERKRIEVYAPREHVSNGSLRGRQYWTWGKSPETSTDNDAVWFVNDRWAYRGIPKGGIPRCKDWTSDGDRPGCVRYWYDRSTGSVQIDDARGKVTDRSLKVEGKAYRHRRGIPKPGRRFDVRLRHFDRDCWVKACDENTYVISLYPDGRYRLFSAKYDGYENTTKKVTRRGRYVVKRYGRMVLTPKHGKRDVRTISVARTANGKLKPKRGITLNRDNYYPSKRKP